MTTQSLRILLVDDNETRLAQLETALTKAGYSVCGVCDSSDDITTVVRRCEPDLILIDVESPGRDTIEHVACISRDRPRPVALFSPDGNPATIRAAIDAGVSAYTAGGLPPECVRTAIDVAVAQFERHQKLCEELESVRQSLADRRYIERAKGFIMSQRECDEPEAYQLLQRMAMDRRKKLGDVAKDLVAMSELLGGRKEA